MIEPWKYFPKPSFLSVREDGSLTLEWCKKDRRDSINVECYMDGQESDPSKVYTIYTDGMVQELIENPSQNQIKNALEGLMGLKAEE